MQWGTALPPELLRPKSSLPCTPCLPILSQSDLSLTSTMSIYKAYNKVMVCWLTMPMKDNQVNKATS
jgi:hypothetical protein